MVEIRRVESQGSPKDKEDEYKVFNVKVWTDELKYKFSFEGQFYSCVRRQWRGKFPRNNRDIVEDGKMSGLESFGVQEVTDYCIEQVKTIEEKERLPMGSQLVLEAVEDLHREPTVQELKNVMRGGRVNTELMEDIVDRLISEDFLETTEDDKIRPVRS